MPTLSTTEAMPSGECLTISLDGRAVLDEIGGEMVQQRQWVVRTIADTGLGIPLDVHTHIFEPFFTTKQTGTGLGLFVIQRIIANHSGIILGTQRTEKAYRKKDVPFLLSYEEDECHACSCPCC